MQVWPELQAKTAYPLAFKQDIYDYDLFLPGIMVPIKM